MKMEKQEKVMNQLYRIGFNLDGSYYSYEEKIFTNEFLKSI